MKTGDSSRSNQWLGDGWSWLKSPGCFRSQTFSRIQSISLLVDRRAAPSPCNGFQANKRYQASGSAAHQQRLHHTVG
uniref:Uncharacterized protein n=1 Tax=Picea glauca TaxID=3330 RepID=A0A117NI90_PICGL|nr:hypothetical protein ABT39_MTgene2775 [Picea glauca]